MTRDDEQPTPGLVERCYMLDTSALARRQKPAIATLLDHLIDSGLVACCIASDLEAGVMARNRREFRKLRDERASWLVVEIGHEVAARARAVQGRLVAKGQHRGVRSFDLLIAAAAETAGLTVLHYDRDFDRIAEVTGQDCKWIVPAGEAK